MSGRSAKTAVVMRMVIELIYQEIPFVEMAADYLYPLSRIIPGVWGIVAVVPTFSKYWGMREAKHRSGRR